MNIQDQEDDTPGFECEWCGCRMSYEGIDDGAGEYGTGFEQTLVCPGCGSRLMILLDENLHPTGEIDVDLPRESDR